MHDVDLFASKLVRATAASCSTSPVIAAPPKVAFCFAGAARTFATPLLLRSHHEHLIKPLAGPHGAAHGSRAFLYLKLADSSKHHADRAASQQFLSHSVAASPLFAAIASDAWWLRGMIGEAAIVNGSGSFGSVGWQPADGGGPESAWRPADERMSHLLRPRAPQCAPAFAKLTSATEIAIAARWCGDAISRYERRAGSAFGLVAFARPDQLIDVPLPSPACFPYHSVVFGCAAGGADGLWAANRTHAAQLMSVLNEHTACGAQAATGSSMVAAPASAPGFSSARHQCSHRQVLDAADAGLKAQCRRPLSTLPPSCCGPGEALLAHALASPSPLPLLGRLCVDAFKTYRFNFARTGLLTSGRHAGTHTCTLALGPAYATGGGGGAGGGAAHGEGGEARGAPPRSMHWAKAAKERSLLLTEARLSEQHAQSLRRLFGRNVSACIAALTPIAKNERDRD